VTRGSWETVEKNSDGSEISNRTLTPTKDASVEIEVKRWADAARVEPGEKPAAKKSTRIGDIRVHKNFHSRILGNERDILVYVPMVDDPDNHRRFPVLYMHDGQNVFDEATSFAGVEWKADETATRLILNGKIEPLIIVAIANTKDRIDEYTLYRDETRKQGGHGRDYMKFVVEEVKPFIDKTYPTRPRREDTGVGGSSLGGTISLEICRAYPEQFGKCIAMSPALWWDDYELLKQLRRRHDSDRGGWISNCRFWIDMGTKEGDTEGARLASIGALQQMEETLNLSGLEQGVGYRSVIARDAQHNELFWASRFEGALTSLYPPLSTTYNTYDEPPASPPTPAPDPAAPHDVAAR
jgi:predicted alpha/beta superfamily hydrolase